MLALSLEMSMSLPEAYAAYPHRKDASDKRKSECG